MSGEKATKFQSEYFNEYNNQGADKEKINKSIKLFQSKLDGNALIEAVIMSEVLGKPKARQKRTGR